MLGAEHVKNGDNPVKRKGSKGKIMQTCCKHCQKNCEEHVN